jgi:hypothetical protein
LGALLGRCLAVAIAGVPIPMPLEDVVVGLDLARARGVVVQSLGKILAGPQSLPTMMTRSRGMHLLGGVVARLLHLWIHKFCLVVGSSSSSLELLLWCKGGLLAWT